MRSRVDWDSVEREGGSTGAHAGEEGWDGKRRRRKQGEREFVVKRDDKQVDVVVDGERDAEVNQDDRVEGEEEESEDKKRDDDSYPFLTVGVVGMSNSLTLSSLNPF